MPMKRRFWPTQAVALALLITVHCASAPPREPEGQIAAYGVKVAETVGQLQRTTADLQRAGIQPFADPKHALAVQEALQKVNEKGVQLAAALRVVDQARAAGSQVSIAEARGLLRDLHALAATLGTPAAEAVKPYLDLVGSLLETLGAVSFELGRVAS